MTLDRATPPVWGDRLRRPDGSRDRRLTPCNGRVADARLRGEVEAERFADPVPRRVLGFSTPLYPVDQAPFLWSPNILGGSGAAAGGRQPPSPAATRAPGPDRELLGGDRFDVLDEEGGWAFGQAAKDGYCGWVRAAALGPDLEPTHAIRLRHAHLYPEPNIKTPPLGRLPFGASVAVRNTTPPWAETAGGWLRADHLRPTDASMQDPVEVAELFLGTPYLWAGNTGDGIDCSGLVQAACLACGIACPGDSDLQSRALGEPLEADAPLRRGDLVFWKGHVALVADERRFIHANGHHMAVVHEPIEATFARIVAGGEGEPIARRRLS